MTQQEIDALAEAFRSQGLTWSQTNFAVSVARNAEAAERSRIASLLRRKHEEVNGAHNYFLVAARMVEGGR